MNISDLNHLEVVEESNIIGGSSNVGNDKERIDVAVKFKFKNDFESKVKLDYNTASGKALADAYGYESKADTFSQTYTEAGIGSSSVSISGSASKPYPSY